MDRYIQAGAQRGYPISWQAQNGGITVPLAFGAVFFALQSAVLSVMLLFARAASAWPVLLYVLLVLLAVETVVVLGICWR